MSDGDLDLAFLRTDESAHKIIDVRALIFLNFRGVKQILADRYPLRYAFGASVRLDSDERLGFGDKLSADVRDSAEVIFARHIVAALARKRSQMASVGFVRRQLRNVPDILEERAEAIPYVASGKSEAVLQLSEGSA